jgi:dTDP-4-amino-4,6-dideoxygalactose transaminase
MTQLAINGGKPVRSTPFPDYVTIGIEERKAVMRVLDSGILSSYLGTWSPDFYGGQEVRHLEAEWAEFFNVKHAISVNSATSGLYAAVGAAGIGPGNEVIVSPYTMSASATAALIYGAVPVFADIDPNIFCISPESIKKCITPYTKAIIVVDLFGHPAMMDEIMEIAKDNDLIVIEDAAQAIGGKYKGRFAGTLADIGVFSLNYHKSIHCGEGGIITTNDDNLAERLQLIRNHAEAVVKNKGTQNIVNMVGYNFRMPEIEAAITREQLKKLKKLTDSRIKAAEYLTRSLSEFPGITPPVVIPDVRHAYYVYAIKYNSSVTGIQRDVFVNALNAEGIPMYKGYAEPLYLQPLYQQRVAIGKDGYPFTYPGYKGKARYDKGICPVTERMYYQELMYTNICHANIAREDLDCVISAFAKILDNSGELA